LQGNRSLASGLLGNAEICFRPESEKTTILINISNGKVKEDEMARACSTNEGRKVMLIGYWWGSQKERDH
jgi:hypothetical protein